jgi:next-to-BRCA1 protein 1
LACALQLRTFLQIKADEQVVFERYSDSSASYVTLESDKPQVYKTLFRAAKAKLKLRLRATVPGEQPEVPSSAPTASNEAVAMASLVEGLHRFSADTLRPQSFAPVSPVIARSPGVDAPAAKFEPVSPESPPKSANVEGEAPLPRSFTARQSKATRPPSKTSR